MRRREFIAGLLFTATMQQAWAQQPSKVVRIGVLFPGLVQPLRSLRQELHKLGYVEGENLRFEYRFPKGADDQYAALANDLVALGVDIIVTWGTPATLAAKRATSVIPIVMASGGDPVGLGLVSSLAHPGGNITGFSSINLNLEEKRLQLLRELVPHLSRVGVLAKATNPYSPAAMERLRRVSEAMGVTVQPIAVQDEDDLEGQLPKLAQARPDAVLVLADTLFFTYHERIARFMLKSRIPAIFSFGEFARAGGLVAYGPDFDDLFRRAAAYIDRIVKGESPRDLPVQQGTKFELIINLKTAEALGLTVPPALLARANEVIE